MNAFETVLYERIGPIAHVTLNRPRVHNAYSVQMRDDLFEILSAIKDDGEVRVMVLRGAGDKAFCGGADLTEFLTAPSVVAARKIRTLRDIWGMFRSMPQPLIAALHGFVLGSGMEMALFCDIRIGAEDVVFGLPEVGLGIIPGAGGTQTVPRAIGLSRSLDILLTNRRIGAQEALRAGLLNTVVPRPMLESTANSMAQQIAAQCPIAVATVKRAIHQGLDLPLEQGLKLEKRLAAKFRQEAGSGNRRAI